jgi:hypothetical protein
MPTSKQVERHLAISAVNDASETAAAWLNAPRPAPGATDAYAMNFHRAWLRILLLDLGRIGERVTYEGAVEILGLADTAMLATLLAQLRRDDEERPPLTARDFARVFKAN